MNKKEKTTSTMIEIIQTTKRSPFALLLTMVFLVSMFLFPTTSKSQDLDFSQYYNNPTYYNPAYVGLTMGLKSRLNYRRQWTGLSGDYHSYSFSADIAERSLPGAGGIGIIAISPWQAREF